MRFRLFDHVCELIARGKFANSNHNTHTPASHACYCIVRPSSPAAVLFMIILMIVEWGLAFDPLSTMAEAGNRQGMRHACSATFDGTNSTSLWANRVDECVLFCSSQLPRPIAATAAAAVAAMNECSFNALSHIKAGTYLKYLQPSKASMLPKNILTVLPYAAIRKLATFSAPTPCNPNRVYFVYTPEEYLVPHDFPHAFAPPFHSPLQSPPPPIPTVRPLIAGMKADGIRRSGWYFIVTMKKAAGVLVLFLFLMIIATTQGMLLFYNRRMGMDDILEAFMNVFTFMVSAENFLGIAWTGTNCNKEYLRKRSGPERDPTENTHAFNTFLGGPMTGGCVEAGFHIYTIVYSFMGMVRGARVWVWCVALLYHVYVHVYV